MNKHIVQTAKELCVTLRSNSTRSEKIFWNEVRNRKFHGKKFLRQHPLFFSYLGNDAFFIADFYCHEHGLVVELDGKHHEYQKDYDTMRTHIINEMNIDVIRFKNDEIEQDLQKVMRRLQEMLKRTHPVVPL